MSGLWAGLNRGRKWKKRKKQKISSLLQLKHLPCRLLKGQCLQVFHFRNRGLELYKDNCIHYVPILKKKGLLMFRKYLFICESSDCLILQFLSLSHRRINIQSLEDGLNQMELIVLWKLMFIELFLSASQLQTNRNSWLWIKNLLYEGGIQNLKLLLGRDFGSSEKKLGWYFLQ